MPLNVAIMVLIAAVCVSGSLGYWWGYLVGRTRGERRSQRAADWPGNSYLDFLDHK